ncbi:MAG: hypothetical protein F6K40_09215 [Okeania sp. SIO3I5]|uniref:DUF3226 domain-containing protein n=1 Tax=Okeania sp. SIO3I5 TaxID=2607805 RepID=UPI0013BB69C1|nr:DUF3226 domain-containing protein [Okeania sp. SIO3I5]NEQ36443.1 hypothetical protein [Okeania sp. SIO3I5]
MIQNQRVEKPKSIEKPKLIIGEGRDEESFFSALIKHLEIDDIQVDSYGGKHKLKNYFKALPFKPGFSNLRSLLITRDADESFDTASQSINGSIRQNKLNEIENLTIKTFIFPDNKSSGMLEDLCLSAINDSDMGCIEEFFQCIKENTNRESNEFSKAKIHAWLSTQTIPDKRLGEAAKAGYFNWNNETFNELINFIKSL